ncbi:hypothetical protein [Emticicia sp.]|uniref:hypothetical protein n=1 Tax=Emticicia sp. TaxID=1930953 RepID=UPI0037535D21
MKKLAFILFLLVTLQSCFVHRPCPIKSCKVEMEHKHGNRTFNPRKIWKGKIHYIGEKVMKDRKKQQKLQKDRRRMERQKN